MNKLIGNRATGNRVALLNLIRDRQSLSRSELSQLTGLTRPTVSAIVNDLTTEKIIIETGKGESSGGKRPILLELNSEYRYVIGIDLGDDYVINGVLCDFCGKIVAQKKLHYENSLDDILKILKELILNLVAKTTSNRLYGVGIAVSGIVNQQTNEIIGSTTLDIKNCGLAAKLEKLCGLPVLLENRPNAAALAETRFGAGREHRSLVYITSGRGVGAGIVIDGKIFRGSFGAAGEIGEMLLPQSTAFDGNTCRQLEEFTRASSITAQVENIKNTKLSFGDIVAAYHADDPEVNSVIQENAKYMAYAAQIVANLLNPEMVVLGGRAAELGDKYLNHFRNCFKQGLIQGPLNGQTIAEYSHFGRLGVAVGGAAIVLEKILGE
ncbi:MAG: ROK family transcriptional regulator [Victivallaceae bacterium]|nr:ROK family transcriptional regulator [Victivallaceae bacterium]